MDFQGTLSIAEIAKFMGKSQIFVRKSIENGSLPIGSYVKQGKRADYYISPKRVYEFMGYKRDEESNYISNSDDNS